MPFKTPPLICMLMSVASAAACSADRPVADAPAGIVFPTDASNLASQNQGDAFNGSYQVRRAYPANGFISEVGAPLMAAGFQPLQQDWLNPGVESSHVRGWGKFTQGSGDNLTQVHQWSAQWRDAAGNVVLYHLQYLSPRTTATMLAAPTTDTLNVTVARVPAAQVAALQQSAAQAIPK